MTLERHVIDTLKEWQLKMGSFDTDIRLYYPKNSLCCYMETERDIDNTILLQKIEEYIAAVMPYLGTVLITVKNDRFCIHISKEGCSYVENNISMPEFLSGLLEVLKAQNMDSMSAYFEEYAATHNTRLYKETDEDDGGTIFYFADENVEPYVYCIDANEFGITYHRFTKKEYEELYTM